MEDKKESIHSPLQDEAYEMSLEDFEEKVGDLYDNIQHIVESRSSMDDHFKCNSVKELKKILKELRETESTDISRPSNEEIKKLFEEGRAESFLEESNYFADSLAHEIMKRIYMPIIDKRIKSEELTELLKSKDESGEYTYLALSEWNYHYNEKKL